MGIQREGSKKPRVIDEDQILIGFCIRYPPSPSLATCPSLIESSKKFSNLPIGITKSYSPKKLPSNQRHLKIRKNKKKTLEDIHHPFITTWEEAPKTSTTFALPRIAPRVSYCDSLGSRRAMSVPVPVRTFWLAD